MDGICVQTKLANYLYEVISSDQKHTALAGYQTKAVCQVSFKFIIR